MPLLDAELQKVVTGATRHFNVVTEKAVSAFVCRHMECEPVSTLKEAEIILQQASAKGFEFCILENNFDDSREIAVRYLGEQEFFDRATLPSFRAVMIGEI